MPSSPPPDRFQREIDDIIRLAERRLEHQSFSYRMRRSTRRLGHAFGGFSLRLPSPEWMGGWGMALLLLAWLMGLPIFGSARLVQVLAQPVLAIGIILLVLAIISSLIRGKAGGSGRSNRMWRGERIAYGSPYGEGIFARLRRLFRGR